MLCFLEREHIQNENDSVDSANECAKNKVAEFMTPQLVRGARKTKMCIQGA